MAKRTAPTGKHAAKRRPAARAGKNTAAAGGKRKKAAASARKRVLSAAARRKTAARAAATKSSRKRKAPRPSRLAAAATLARGAAAGALAAVAATLPWATDEHDPIVLLETDHRRFEALLKQGDETTDRAVKRRVQLLSQLTRELTVHELIEEKVLYPALAEHPEARDIVLEGYQEHHVADLIVKELHGLASGDERWGAKFKVLKENIEHHIEEEEHEMFRTARAVLGRDELSELGARMKALKAEHEA